MRETRALRHAIGDADVDSSYGLNEWSSVDEVDAVIWALVTLTGQVHRRFAPLSASPTEVQRFPRAGGERHARVCCWARFRTRRGRSCRLRLLQGSGHQGAIAAATARISSGPTRQQPPTSRAPAATQAGASAGWNVKGPAQPRAVASQSSPLFG